MSLRAHPVLHIILLYSDHCSCLRCTCELYKLYIITNVLFIMDKSTTHQQFSIPYFSNIIRTHKTKQKSRHNFW